MVEKMTVNKCHRSIISANMNPIPEMLIALTLSLIFAENTVTFFVAILLCIYALYLFIWLKKTVWEWGVFFVYGRKCLSENLFEFFKENDFPEPDDEETSCIEYLEKASKNENLPMKVRLEAFRKLGEVNALMYPQSIMRTFMVYKEGLKLYKASF